MIKETSHVGGQGAWEMFVGEDEAGNWTRPIVRYWGFLFSGFVSLVVWFPIRATAAGLKVLLWVAAYIVYSSCLEVLSRRVEAQSLYETKIFRLFRIHFNLMMFVTLALVAPPTASSYLWFFFSMPLLATLGYFGHPLPLLAVYLEVCASMLVLTFAQGWSTPLDLAAMFAKDAILGLLTAVLYFFVHLSPRAREESMLLKAATTLIQVLDQRELCQLLADTAKVGVPAAEAAVIHLLGGEDGQMLVPSGSSNIDLTTLGRTPMEVGKGIAGHAIQNCKTIYVPDVDEDERYLQLSPSFTPFKALLVAPMYVGSKKVGTISVHSAKRGIFSRQSKRFLTTLAAQGAMAIANAELYDTRTRRRQQISDILDASHAFGLNQPLDALLETVASEVCRCSGYQMAVVNLLDEASDEIVVRAMAGVPSAGRRKLEGMRIPHNVVTPLLQDEFCISRSYFIRHDRCPEISDLDQYTFTPDLGKREPGEWHPEDMLIVPIQTQKEKLLGYISIDDPSDRQLPSRDTIQALEILASVVATAIQNARLYEEQRHRATQLALINDIGGKIAAVLELDSVLDRAVCLVQESFGYHHAALFTVDRERGEVVMRTRAGDFAHLYPPDHRLKLGQGMVGWVGCHGKTLLANDVRVEPRYVNFFPDVIPTQSELSMPIAVGDDVLGVLDVQSPQLNAFDENDVMVMKTLADQIAVAIKNAQLYSEREQQEVRLQEYLSTVTNLAHHTSLEGLYQFIVETGARFLSARDCSLYLTSDENINSTELVSTTAPSPSADGSKLVDHVVEWGLPVRLLGIEMLQHPLWNGELWAVLGGWNFDPESDRSLLAVPVCTPNECIIGVLMARGAEGDGGFSKFDEELLKTLATNAVADIERVRSLEKARKDAIRAERKRLETDLHEAMNILATGVRWEAEILSDEIERNDLTAARIALTRLQAARTRAYTDLRYLLQDLRDPTLEQSGLLTALKKRAELIGRGRIMVHGDMQERLPPEIEGAFYRVGQEAMDNAVKHSGFVDDPNVLVEVDLQSNNGQARLCVKDDGVGFNVDSILALPHKWGLRRLLDALHETGGELNIDSTPGKGTAICATIDLTKASHEQQDPCSHSR